MNGFCDTTIDIEKRQCVNGSFKIFLTKINNTLNNLMGNGAAKTAIQMCSADLKVKTNSQCVNSDY